MERRFRCCLLLAGLLANQLAEAGPGGPPLVRDTPAFGPPVIVGGYENTAEGEETAIVGGKHNLVSNICSVVVGGIGNTAIGLSSAVVGGSGNFASDFSVALGGRYNTASAAGSLAAGQQAEALHPYTFVWADYVGRPFSSTSTNQFLIRARGGVGINTNVTWGRALVVAGDTEIDGRLTVNRGLQIAGPVLGLTAAHVGAVATSDARYLAALTNAAAFATAAQGATAERALPLAGGTMEGDIDMGGQSIVNAGSLVLGQSLLVTGPVLLDSLSIGSGNASGLGSFAQGYETRTLGDFSHAEGYCTLASDLHAHAEGGLSQATALDAHAEGAMTVASGPAAHAEGVSTLAAGIASHAAGWGAVAAHANTFVWADGDPAASTTDRQFTVSAANGTRLLGGVGINTNVTCGRALVVAGDADIDGLLTVSNGLQIAGPVFGLTAAHVGAVSTSDARYLAALTNAAAFATAAQGVTAERALPLAGGTMEGDIDMGGHSISNAGSLVAIQSLVVAGPGLFNRLLIGSGNASGEGCFAQGAYACAEGKGAHAEGCGTCAFGTGTHAEGQLSMALEFAAHAEGCNTCAAGVNSHAEGHATWAPGLSAHAEGESTLAYGLSAHAENACTIASGTESHAEGRESQADGTCAHSEGYQTIAAGLCSHAEGCRTLAFGAASHAGGYLAKADHDNTFVWSDGSPIQSTADRQFTVCATNGIYLLGGPTHVATPDTNDPTCAINYGTLTNQLAASRNALSNALANLPVWNLQKVTDSGPATTHIIQVGTTTGNDPDAVNVQYLREYLRSYILGEEHEWVAQYLTQQTPSILTNATETLESVTARGNETSHSIVIGTDGIAEGRVLIVGNRNVARGTGILAHGEGVVAEGSYLHAEGYATTAYNSCAHVEGYSSAALAFAAHAEGAGVLAGGDRSHAEGCFTYSRGEESHAEGHSTYASGFASHAENGATMASGEFSHAENLETEASGSGAHAEGYQTIASGTYAHAEGRQNSAAGFASHAAGYHATASHDNTFVWSDGTETNSTMEREFTVCARNGIRLGAGRVTAEEGIVFTKPLGDLQMGCFTNRPQ